MDGYNGKRRFDREQLVFVVEVMMTGAVDQVSDTLPPYITLTEANNNSAELHSGSGKVVVTVGYQLAILHAQVTGDGMGTGDAITNSGFDKFMARFVQKCLQGPEGRVFHHGELCYPPTRSLAKKFVDEFFKEYIDDTRSKDR